MINLFGYENKNTSILDISLLEDLFILYFLTSVCHMKYTTPQKIFDMNKQEKTRTVSNICLE